VTARAGSASGAILTAALPWRRESHARIGVAPIDRAASRVRFGAVRNLSAVGDFISCHEIIVLDLRRETA
jgi:hypothetical protein